MHRKFHNRYNTFFKNYYSTFDDDISIWQEAGKFLLKFEPEGFRICEKELWWMMSGEIVVEKTQIRAEYCWGIQRRSGRCWHNWVFWQNWVFHNRGKDFHESWWRGKVINATMGHTGDGILIESFNLLLSFFRVTKTWWWDRFFVIAITSSVLFRLKK